ncbi:MAG TPA: hypothetical protein ENN07_02890 [candidate division Zixibacteria bacterium]|nr:hypothetical protein [candidate division Zixibacteria bacterium]
MNHRVFITLLFATFSFVLLGQIAEIPAGDVPTAETTAPDTVAPEGLLDPRERPEAPMAAEGLEIGKVGEYSFFSSDAVGIGTGAVEPGAQLEIYSPTGTGTVDMLRLRSKHDTGPNVYSLYFSPREVSYVIENGATGTNLTLSTKGVSGGSFQADYGNILLMPHGNVGIGTTAPPRGCTRTAPCDSKTCPNAPELYIAYISMATVHSEDPPNYPPHSPAGAR